VIRLEPTRTLLKASAALLAAALLAFGFTAARASAQDPVAADTAGGAAVIQNPDTIVNPVATAQDATPTPTPESSATPVPFATPGASATPAPKPSQKIFGTPGYGNAAKQKPAQKRKEQRRACRYSAIVPPTSHMLGVPGVSSGSGGGGGSWIPLVLAIAVGAGLFAAAAYKLRKRNPDGGQVGMLEGFATFVAICGGLAALAAQFFPGARVEQKPPQRVAMTVRDVKPRITRGEYLKQMGVPLKPANGKKSPLSRVDLDEVGNVVWLQITVQGFKGRDLRLQYGSYDLDSHSEALLPDTSKPVALTRPSHNVQTYFYPAWVGYPRSKRFKAEFRLIDLKAGGVQQLAETEAMRGTQFRYVCPQHTA
jgi:hypothetical protein